MSGLQDKKKWIGPKRWAPLPTGSFQRKCFSGPDKREICGKVEGEPEWKSGRFPAIAPSCAGLQNKATRDRLQQQTFQNLILLRHKNAKSRPNAAFEANIVWCLYQNCNSKSLNVKSHVGSCSWNPGLNKKSKFVQPFSDIATCVQKPTRDSSSPLVRFSDSLALGSASGLGNLTTSPLALVFVPLRGKTCSLPHFTSLQSVSKNFLKVK